MRKMVNAIIIIDDEGNKTIFYECDKQKNKECEKSYCHKPCYYTTELKYAKDITNEKEVIQLKEEIEQHKETIRKLMVGENIFEFRTPNYIRDVFNLTTIKNNN